MPELVKIEETVELPHPRAAVWPILARTDWINRAIGLPPVKYEIKPLPEGGSEITARAENIRGKSRVARISVRVDGAGILPGAPDLFFRVIY